MKRTDNSSSAPNPDPSADKSPSMEDDETTSGSQQKPEPDVEVVPKDTNCDSFQETKTLKLIKPLKTLAERAAFIEERNRMRRYHGPAARTNYSVKREKYDIRTLRTMPSSSARYQQQRASAIMDAPPSPDESEDEFDEEEEMKEEEEDLKLGKEVVTIDDSMEDEEVSNNGEKQILVFEDGETIYKTYVPTLRKLLDKYFVDQETAEIYDAMKRKAVQLNLCDNWQPIQKLIDMFEVSKAVKAKIQEKLKALSIRKYIRDGEPSSTFVECLLDSIYCSGPDMSDAFVLCADVFTELYCMRQQQEAVLTDAGNIPASSSSSSVAVKENSDNQEMATSASEKLTNNSKIVYESSFTDDLKLLKKGCVSIPELISGKVIFSQDVSVQDLQAMTEKYKELSASDFDDIFKKNFLNKLDNIDQVIQEVKDILEGRTSLSEDNTSVAKAILQCTFCIGAKPTDQFIFCEDLFSAAKISDIFYCSAVKMEMTLNATTPVDSKKTEDVSKKRQHSSKASVPSSKDNASDDTPPSKK
ncbi:hypothetical protein CRE_31251 [Caenorhabditis remanei]|uniref:Uncharacterized protein n=1 Tax=Caenorhabditis remanei TaxID=31234 RepID=E3MLU4_CAERE|nr:hypothetical protein CRE_31251 [Caenorhabditis remanei]